MALSGSVSVEATPNGRDMLVFSWSAVQDAEALTSTVTWQLRLVADAYGALDVTDAAIYPWTVTVDGQAFSGNSNIFIGVNETVTLATGEAVLAHAADGTKTFAFTFMQDFCGLVWSGATEINEVSGSGSGELDPLTVEEAPEEFPILDFVNGMIMALCSPARYMKREPVAFLYGHVAKEGETPTHTINGVGYVGAVCPDIDTVWTDKETHPYAFVTNYLSASVYALVLSNVPIENRIIGTYGVWNASARTYVFRDGAWDLTIDGESSPYNAFFDNTNATVTEYKGVWTNTDVYNADTIFFAASEPIPVYE